MPVLKQLDGIPRFLTIVLTRSQTVLLKQNLIYFGRCMAYCWQFSPSNVSDVTRAQVASHVPIYNCKQLQI